MSENLDQRLRTVTSRQNSLVKQLRSALHNSELTDDGCCAIEGVRQVEEALRSSLKLKALFVSESAVERAHRVLPQVSSHTEALLLPDDVFKSAVSTEAPQGVAALARLRTHTLEDVLSVPESLLVVAAGLQDPGNLGTIIRSAEAFGAAAVIATEGTVSPYNAKAIRGSAGSLFRLPVVRASSAAVLSALRQDGFRIFATSSHKSVPVHQVELRGAVAIIIGNEGAGVPREMLAQADATIAIPHSPQVESLNAGIAASVVLYEAMRQRTVQR